MRYSVLAGGKRIRPILMLTIADMFNRPYGKILPAACSLEYTHTSTLILDDLPCMDNSDLRRGMVSVHKKFGESTAILASYALVMLAFELLAENAEEVSNDAGLMLNVISTMSKAMGFMGLCAGQYIDLESGAQKIDIETLGYLHQHKTADLFIAGCEIVGYLSGATDVQLSALRRYGRYTGLAFQAYDDMLSLKKTDIELGKETRKDKGSPNLVNLFGVKKAQDRLNLYVKQSELQLTIFKTKADILKSILRYAVHRER